MNAHGSQQRALGERGDVVKITAHAHAHDDGRARIGASVSHRVKHERAHAVDAIRGLEHLELPHVL